MMCADSMRGAVKNRAVFQVIGEKAEDEGGVCAGDIAVLMRQLAVERNAAVRALKQEGDVLDAIIHLAHKQW